MAAVVGGLPVLVGEGLAGAAMVADYSFSAAPIAPTATLKPLANYPVGLTVLNAAGQPLRYATVYLLFRPAPGGGIARTWRGALSATPQAINADGHGHIVINYHTPKVLPPEGSDVIFAQDRLTAPRLQAQTGYTFGSDWSRFHFGPLNQGVTNDGAIKASTAAGLKVAWHTALNTPSLASPAVAYNAALGRTLVYVGGQAVPGQGAPFGAFDAATGAVVWRVNIRGGNIVSSAAISGGVVYVGAATTLYALDANTGANMCSFPTPGRVIASPVLGDADSFGPTVYFGDTGKTGGPDQGHFWAVRADTCALRWQFRAFGDPPGSVVAASYDEPAFAHDAAGRPLVVFGSTDPDNAVYALDARTGVLVWRFQTALVADGDVGAGPTISEPGLNGFAGGVVYITGKDEKTYALNLTTGAQIWMFDIKADSGNPKDTQSVAALAGGRLFLGYGAGVYCLNAITGAKVWRVDGLPQIYSSPAVSGPANDQVFLIGDLAGNVRAFDLGGNQVRSMNTGGSVFSSPAIVGTRAFFTDAATGLLTAIAIPSP